MIGTTRSRVNFFLNKFKKLGFIEYNGELPLKVNSSLLSVVLHDDANARLSAGGALRLVVRRVLLQHVDEHTA